MRIETAEIRNGNFDDKIVWVCHYNRPDMDKKPLRNIPPTKVLVRNVSKYLPHNKSVYYTESFLTPFKKNGVLSSKVISPVDNTGYRTFIGNELCVFDDEESCIKEWDIQINKHIIDIDNHINKLNEYWALEKTRLISYLN